MSLIVDFEGFKLPHRSFIIKEFAYLNLDNNERMCYFFKAPDSLQLTQSERRIVSWITKNIHNIEWDYGATDFYYLDKLLNHLTVDSHAIFYVKGDEKKQILEKLTNFQTKIVDLESLGCPKFQDLFYPFCMCGSPRHININHCALKKVLALSTWLKYAAYKE
jgi:hypothetical protein